MTLGLWITFQVRTASVLRLLRLSLYLGGVCFSVTMLQLSAVSQAEARTTLVIFHLGS